MNLIIIFLKKVVGDLLCLRERLPESYPKSHGAMRLKRMTGAG